MAKVFSPLLSINASGQFGKSIVYASWKGINYAREYFIPTNADTAQQQVIRGYFKDAITAWKALTSPNKAVWDTYASAHSLQESGYNLFVGAYVKFLINSAGTPPTGTNNPPNMT